ncbi:nuclear transport factor 2 family protein [Amycolatopsis acidicola]|uniref:Nuclear transport factor 2 family protein n=1 Tax=Amycolatopsis acidicola TaxID=2596893 RepID=A0A5N0V3G2_9PSEU|nr:nuclear transport factor 2 family protein [Amycolatopsis acidicola]KAA9160515.1 nuclear transport factor 2 family protein [Amycolatopsis acidicola]
MSEASAVVTAFYEAVSKQDGDAVRSVVRDNFAEDAVLRWPESLPYGGSVAGKSKLERVLAGAASAGQTAGVQNLRLTGVVDGGDTVAAQLEFDWRDPKSERVVTGTGAVEVWSFTGGRVGEIKAYYWDTAACLGFGS